MSAGDPPSLFPAILERPGPVALPSWCTAELSQAHGQLRQIQTEARSLLEELAASKETGRHAESLSQRLAERELQVEELLRGKNVLDAALAGQSERRQALEIELAAAQASLAIQEKVMADLHTQLLSLGSRRKRSGQQAAGVGAKTAASDAS